VFLVFLVSCKRFSNFIKQLVKRIFSIYGGFSSCEHQSQTINSLLGSIEMLMASKTTMRNILDKPMNLLEMALVGGSSPRNDPCFNRLAIFTLVDKLCLKSDLLKVVKYF